MILLKINAFLIFLVICFLAGFIAGKCKRK
nr:MAG TPA: Protein of unknown function (DUF1043) [Caudoviricetes sp.]